MSARVLIVDVLKKSEVGASVTISGWVRTRRDSKEFSFLEVNDGSCFACIQVLADTELDGFKDSVLQASTGASVTVEGELVESPGKGQSLEIKATKVDLIGASHPDYPLQKKRHTNEYLRTIAHLRPRTNTFGAVFRLRSKISYAIHSFFQERNFVHLHSPIITSSDCEGAGELFTVTTLDLKNVAKTDFFNSHTGLTVSGQLEAEAFACGLSNVYTFGPTFRAENSNTPRHLAEFWMIEPEMAFCDIAGDMELAEDFIKYIIRAALEQCEEDMKFFNQWIEKGLIESLEAVVNADFERITYTEAVEALQKSKSKFVFPVSWGCDLQTEHERYLTEEYVGKPVFVIDYPKDIKAFYMKLNDDERTVSAMDLLVPRLGEIIGGSQREEREDVLLEKMRKLDIPEQEMWWYLELRRFGTVPHAGFGLGFERMLMYLSGVQNIRDIIPFPRTPGTADF
ncbi:UNVERIFIED_CONTAM: hypothetical protein GTU68_054366 [Idotea baltica]|nr:hypothetical protein [Idotea baltica]